MKKKIENVYAAIRDYNCFGCSPTNPVGLRLEFYEEGEYITSEYTPTVNYEGFMNVLHGGIQATLLDEIANWVLVAKLNSTGVTSSMNITYHKPVFVSNGPLVLRAKMIKEEGRLVTVLAELLDKENVVRCSAEVVYFVYPPEVAKKKLNIADTELFTDK